MRGRKCESPPIVEYEIISNKIKTNKFAYREIPDAAKARKK
jgi:hypothetical protein